MQIFCVCADARVNCLMEITHVNDLQRKIEKEISACDWRWSRTVAIKLNWCSYRAFKTREIFLAFPFVCLFTIAFNWLNLRMSPLQNFLFRNYWGNDGVGRLKVAVALIFNFYTSRDELESLKRSRVRLSNSLKFATKIAAILSVQAETLSFFPAWKFIFVWENGKGEKL